ncbi:hypothetical protein [Rhodococcus sp. NPDC060084]|uniref:hypothetical protein n=1 Tax=Rhodococcus sp. NPDC060084 TaxID=3347053 RepID=UPI003651DF8D
MSIAGSPPLPTAVAQPQASSEAATAAPRAGRYVLLEPLRAIAALMVLSYVLVERPMVAFARRT